MIDSTKRFLVAFSFPGEHREFVAKVANLLGSELDRQRVLYDKFHEAEFARPNLDTHLQALYHKESELVVVFLCADYERKEWPGLEWRAIRDLIKKKHDSGIMLVRLDNADISGVFSTDGYIDAEGRLPADITALIVKRLHILETERRLLIPAPDNVVLQGMATIPEGQVHARDIPVSEKRPQIPQPIRDVIDRGVDLLNSGHFEKAKLEFQQAVILAEEAKHSLAVVDAKEHLALVLTHFERDVAGARTLLESCLDLLAAEDNDEERAEILDRLAHVHELEGDLEISESLLRQSLAIYERISDKQAQAGTLVNLAWTLGRRGITDEALRLNSRSYELVVQALYEAKKDDTRGLEFIYSVLGNVFFQRAKIHQRRAEPDEAEHCLETALEWQRKVQPNHELAKLLREFAKLKFFKRQQSAGVSLLQEAATLFQERGMLTDFAECLHIMGRVHASFGALEEAGELFSGAAAAAGQSGRSEEAAEILLSLAYLAEEQHDGSKARQLFESAKAASDDGEFQAKCLMALGHLEVTEGNEDERHRLVTAAVKLLKEEIPKTKSEMDRARQYLTVGWYLRELGQLEEALSYVGKARERFENAGDAYNAAKAAFEATGLLDHLGRKQEARAMSSVVLKMIAGKPFFDITAAVELGRARFAVYEDRNLDEAERLLEHALEICKEHDLPLLPEVLLLQDELETIRHVGTEATASIADLLEDLHQQLMLCPANKEGYLRLWAFSHVREFSSALSGSLGPNFGILTDDLVDFLQLSSVLKPYRDWSLIIPTRRYPENIFEIIPFTGKMLVPRNSVALIGIKSAKERDSADILESSDRTKSLKKLRVSPEIRAHLAVSRFSTGGKVARYYFVSLGDKSEEFGGATSGAQGESLALPPAIHELLQGRAVEELKANKLFFLYYNRGLVEERDRFFYDLAGLQRFRCLPVYRGSLPHSRTVRVVASCPVTLPVLTDKATENHRRALRGIRRALIDVLAANESSAAGRLADLAALTEDFADEVGRGASLSVSFYVLGFDHEGTTRTHAAMVLK